VVGQDTSYRAQYLSRLLSEENGPGLYGDYNAYHKARFDYVLKKCVELCPDKDAKVLDVGRSQLSQLLSKYYYSVTTIGFPLNEEEAKSASDGDRAFDGHIVYDLNCAQELRPIETSQRFSLIVFAEVIEHLYTAPELTLFVLSELLEPGGHMIIQTPNASALHKRLKLMCGLHPYQRIRINNRNPGHYREYTKRELIGIVQTVGLQLTCHEYKDYFSIYGSPVRKAAMLLNRVLVTAVPHFARGQTLIVSRPK
jgi:2-polyprenyl-3-methyl-5-hydroxy-6-metoxy-1,4-benzoquinol methylase